MEANYAWLDDPEVFRVNQLPAHSDHVCYASLEDCREGRSGLCVSLSGQWQFHYAPEPSLRPRDIWDEGAFPDTIAVPGHIELAGYGQIQYVNTLYPWDGLVYRRPPYTLGQTNIKPDFAVAADNPVGTYRRTFSLPEAFRGKRVRICFEGAEQALYVWLNGSFVGYATDSFSPSEFDLTPYIREENVLVVQLFKRSVAAYVEDQDFFRFFGLFRDVKLFALPRVHLEDVWVRPLLSDDLAEGTVWGRVKYSAETAAALAGCTLTAALQTPERETLSTRTFPLSDEGTLEFTLPKVPRPRLWDNRRPALYRLTLTLLDGEGEVLEVVPQPIGFRRIEVKDSVIYLNGRRLIVCGVNRHEWNPHTGRAVSLADMEADIQTLKANHINAVRTCHYPNDLRWYRLCDENGIYLCAEANFESHGSWQKLDHLEPSWNVPGDLPQWEALAVDRVRTLFETFKNHPSILFWSLANESYAGEGPAAMYRWLRRAEPERPIHYEGVVWRMAYLDRCTDIYSRMYPTPAQVEEYLQNDPSKPCVLCEFMHSMGNSVGGMGAYMALLDRYPQYQGGFLWDLIDQALYRPDPVTGREVLAYGGDFGERPSNYEFSANGLLFADRSEKPAMQEVRYYYGRCAQQ